jgi:hypothetical protein
MATTKSAKVGIVTSLLSIPLSRATSFSLYIQRLTAVALLPFRTTTSSMHEILKNAVAALIALVGTVLAILVGYRQWKRQQQTTREGEFRFQKQQTYKELWEKLEDVHIRLRTGVVSSDEFRSLIRDVNSYILKRGLYLEGDDQQLANQYLSKVREFTDLVAACDSGDAKEAVSETAEIPSDVILNVRGLGKIQTEVNQIREEILVRYRRVLLGNITAK